MPEEADANEAMEAVVRRVLDEVSTSFPATIIAPSAIEGLVDVQPNVKFKTVGDDIPVEPAAINNVVLIYPGRTNRTIIRPPKEDLIGSKVLVLACEHSLTEWRGGEGVSIYPAENRRFNLNDAVAVLGFYPETITWSNPQLSKTFEFLGVEGTKFKMGTDKNDLLKIMYDFLNFFQTVSAADGDTLAANLTTAQTGLLADLKTQLANITNI